MFKVQDCALNGRGNFSTVKTYFGAEGSDPFEVCMTTTDGNGLLTSIERSENGASNTYTYDNAYRLATKKTDYKSKRFTVTYGYNKISGNRVSSRVQSESLEVGSTQEDSYCYEYYNNGNLKAIYSGTNLLARYFYDEQNRLIREDNCGMDNTFVYEYDDNGNITAKKKYALTDGEVNNLTCDTFNYVYSEDEWKDQLTSYNGSTISYDELGNPTNYRGKTLRWCGRKLISADDLAMEYDYNGLRLRKGEKKYYWQGNTLKAESYIDEESGLKSYIYYYYDESGVCGMRLHSYDYFFRKNAFGDIIAIYDEYGNLHCTYTYDAWGNYEISGLNKTIGELNPFRYRGYYYDTELGLYYLQSRYYDPEVGRFISADDVSYLAPDEIFGLNLYAYCNNNPIKFIKNSKKSTIALGGNYSSSDRGIIENNAFNFPDLCFSCALYDSDRDGKIPDWVYCKALYASGGINLLGYSSSGVSLLYLEAGIAYFGFRSPKFFSGLGLSDDSIINPNIYLEVHTPEVNASAGLGGASGDISLISAKAGFNFGDNIFDLSIRGYVGYGASFDLNNGLKFGSNFGLLPVGVEVNFSFDWVKLIKLLFGVK